MEVENRNMEIINALTSKDSKNACAFAEKIAEESIFTDKWYEYFDLFASLLNHKNSFVRNRAFLVLSANAKWDKNDKFSFVLPEFISHITDEKPISARQCIKALEQIAEYKPQYKDRILSALNNADLREYKDSMRPLLEKDIAKTVEKISKL